MRTYDEFMSENGQENGKANGNKTPKPSPISGFAPPVAHQFKKGNPGGPGRPRGHQFTNHLERLLAKCNKRGTEASEVFIKAGMRAALRGDYRFWAYIYDRMEGKVPDRLAGHDGGPIKNLNLNVELLQKDPEAMEAMKLLARKQAKLLLNRNDDDHADDGNAKS